MSASARRHRRTASGLIAVATALALLPLQAIPALAAPGKASASTQFAGQAAGGRSVTAALNWLEAHANSRDPVPSTLTTTVRRSLPPGPGSVASPRARGVATRPAMATAIAADPVIALAFRASYAVLTVGSARVSAQPAPGGTTLTWNGSVSTDWNTAANWTPAAVPGAADDAVIAAVSTEPSLTSAVTVQDVTIASGASLTTNGQALTVNGTLTNNGLLETVGDTTSSISGAVTNNCTLRVEAASCCNNTGFPATLTVTGPLTNTSTGIIELTGQAGAAVTTTAELDVSGTLANSGAINALRGTLPGNRVLRVNALTGAITAVDNPLSISPFSGTTLTSSATVTAQGGGPITITVPAGGTFTNAGTLTAASYPITITDGSGASFTNSGTLTATSSPRVIVSGGTFVLGTGTITGAVELDGAALAPGTVPASASLFLTAGSTSPGPDPVINNGNISLTGSTMAGPVTNNGLLETVGDTTSSISGAVTNNGTLRVEAASCCNNTGFPATLTVTGPLTNTSTGIIELTGQAGAAVTTTAELDVSGTLANSGAINALRGTLPGNRVLRVNALTGAITAVDNPLSISPFSGTTLTSSATVTAQGGGPITITVPAGGTFTNAGTLTAASYPITITDGSGASFTNSGTLTATSSPRVIVSGGTFVLGTGTITGAVELDGAALAPGTVPASASLFLTAGSTSPGPDPVINNGNISLTGSTMAGPVTNNGLLETVGDTTSSISGAVTNNGT